MGCDYYCYTYIVCYDNNKEWLKSYEISCERHWFSELDYGSDSDVEKAPELPKDPNPKVLYQDGKWIKPEYENKYKKYIKENVALIVKKYEYEERF